MIELHERQFTVGGGPNQLILTTRMDIYCGRITNHMSIAPGVLYV